MAQIKKLPLFLWIAVAALALLVGTSYLFLRGSNQDSIAAAGFGRGTYQLVDQEGQPVDQTIFDGHPSILFFGYTHCPDVCPTTLSEMASWFETLGDDAKDLHGYFVTVDPDRDTTEVMKDYVSWVGDRVTGLTGTDEQIAKIVEAWGIYVNKVPLDGGIIRLTTPPQFFCSIPGGSLRAPSPTARTQSLPWKNSGASSLNRVDAPFCRGDGVSILGADPIADGCRLSIGLDSRRLLEALMKPRINIITVGVDDLERAFAFYRAMFDLTDEQIGAGEEHVAFFLDADLSFVLFPRDQIANTAGAAAATPGTPQFVLSHTASTAKEIDTILERVLVAGGTITTHAQQSEWGYSAYFADTEGNLWEVLAPTATH
ncbi:SCO family protein [Devosia rhodophyticola]|uniref:SCO family protein n=1 Tax=Devosia rhodophyticola TaxID=3026423 RepID=A0ABY7Z1A8_9HYPH|nr:SCO family protein [Devosia rhodophyticola]WDR06795.1 SCO family protein [Devosia rhodophyticola]